jgi:hypothetical protein
MLANLVAIAAARPLKVCTILEGGFSELKHDETKWFNPLKDGQDIIGYDAMMRESLLGTAMGLEYELLVKPSYDDTLRSVAARECDVGWAPFTTTSKREGCHVNCTNCSCVDFSHAYFDGTIGFMYRRQALVSQRTPLEALTSPMVVNTICLFMVMMVVSAHILWYCESRGHNPQFPVPYREGIAEGVWWAVVTAVRFLSLCFLAHITHVHFTCATDDRGLRR